MVGRLKYYWDACSWIGLINQEADKIDSLRHIIEEAQKAKVEIWTSTFTLAEVFKRKCSFENTGLDQDGDRAFEDYLEQDFVQRAQLDTDIGTAARRLLRKFPSIRKPQDAIHAATAAFYDVDELHTFDGSDLLPLDGKIPMANGRYLKVCKPPPPPDPNKGTLFENISPPLRNPAESQNEPQNDKEAGSGA